MINGQKRLMHIKHANWNCALSLYQGRDSVRKSEYASRLKSHSKKIITKKNNTVSAKQTRDCDFNLRVTVTHRKMADRQRQRQRERASRRVWRTRQTFVRLDTSTALLLLPHAPRARRTKPIANVAVSVNGNGNGSGNGSVNVNVEDIARARERERWSAWARGERRVSFLSYS